MQTLSETQSAIRRQGLDWEAGNTPIGRHFEAGKFGGLGFSPRRAEPSGGRGKISQQSFAFGGQALPTQADWRNVNDKDWTTPIRDQGLCGSCVAFATCAVLETRARIKKEDPSLELRLSEAHLFFCGGPKNGCEIGWHSGAALAFCRDTGVGREADFKYEAKQLKCLSSQAKITPALKVRRWQKIGMGNPDAQARKKAISFRGPVIGGMVVYADFGWYRGGVYRPTTSEVVGLHAIAVIGYDDKQGCWLIKNSWGAIWGEGGWGRIGYGVCGLDSSFEFYDPEVDLFEISP